jgi:hypothetical protein
MFYAPTADPRVSMRGCAMCDAPVLGFGTPDIMLIMIMDYGLWRMAIGYALCSMLYALLFCIVLCA